MESECVGRSIDGHGEVFDNSKAEIDALSMQECTEFAWMPMGVSVKLGVAGKQEDTD